jgi:hypothetical protein
LKKGEAQRPPGDGIDQLASVIAAGVLAKPLDGEAARSSRHPACRAFTADHFGVTPGATVNWGGWSATLSHADEIWRR